jgi:hypothetical protein
MNKKFVKEVHKELKNLGYYIQYCGSDCNEKLGLYKPTKQILTSNFRENFTSVCEFVVGKKGKNEYFIVWDYRENQPYYGNEFCTYEGGFGRYDFQCKSDFLNHINNDYGLTFWDKRDDDNIIKQLNKN